MTHTAENNAGRCGCCDSPLVNGACPTRWVDNDGEECSACVIPPGLSASSAPATESGQA